MKKILNAAKGMSIKRFYVEPFTVMVDCPLCGGEHKVEYDMFYYPQAGKSDTIGCECPVGCDAWDDAPDDDKPETEYEIHVKITGIKIEVEIGKSGEKCDHQGGQ